MLKRLLTVLVLAGACLADEASAKQIRCDTCRDDLSFRAEAERAGQGTHIIYSLETAAVQQWYVGPGGTGGGGVPSGLPNTPARVSIRSSPTVQKQTPPPGATQEAARARDLYVVGGGTIRPIIVVPIGNLPVNPNIHDATVYNFINDRNMQGQIETAAGRPEVLTANVGADVLTALADLTNLATNYLGVKDMAALLFKIVFKDGSYVIIQVDLNHANGKYEPDSARTAGGQTVPSNLDEVQGVWWNYSAEDLSPMVSQMQYLGATITYVGSQHGSVRTISCSGSGAAKTCVVETQVW